LQKICSEFDTDDFEKLKYFIREDRMINRNKKMYDNDEDSQNKEDLNEDIIKLKPMKSKNILPPKKQNIIRAIKNLIKSETKTRET